MAQEATSTSVISICQRFNAQLSGPAQVFQLILKQQVKKETGLTSSHRTDRIPPKKTLEWLVAYFLMVSPYPFAAGSIPEVFETFITQRCGSQRISTSTERFESRFCQQRTKLSYTAEEDGILRFRQSGSVTKYNRLVFAHSSQHDRKISNNSKVSVSDLVSPFSIPRKRVVAPKDGWVAPNSCILWLCHDH